MSRNDIIWTMFVFGVLGLAILPSTSIDGLVAVFKRTSIGLLAAAGLLLCYLAFMLMPR